MTFPWSAERNYSHTQINQQSFTVFLFTFNPQTFLANLFQPFIVTYMSYEHVSGVEFT